MSRLFIEDTALEYPCFLQFLADCRGLEELVVNKKWWMPVRSAEGRAALEKQVRNIVGDRVEVRVTA